MARISSRTNAQRWPAMLLSCLATYVGLYGLLSVGGRYQDNVSALDKLGPPCLCISDLDEWQPALVVAAHLPESAVRKTNDLGLLFLPLVIIDQRYWHATKIRIFGENVDVPN